MVLVIYSALTHLLVTDLCSRVHVLLLLTVSYECSIQLKSKSNLISQKYPNPASCKKKNTSTM